MKNRKPRKILAVDDSQTDLFLLKSHLQKMELTVILANDGRKGIEIAVSEQPDLILLDVVLTDIDGFDVCKKLKADTRTSAIPVIFISSNDRPCDTIAGLNVGAVDYIAKPFDPGELKARVESVLRTLELEERILSLANTDELTGLANRRRFFDVLEREILQAKIRGGPLTMMMLDIDHFKDINDTYGHPMGDAILKQVGKILNENVYPLDVAARYGGEEFTIIMPQTPYVQAVQAAEKLRRIIDEWQCKVREKRISITVSIGIASIDSLDSHELIRRADKALCVAKKRGRNCIVCWEEANGGGKAQRLGNPAYRELQEKVSSLAECLGAQVMETVSAFVRTLAVKDKYVARHAQNAQVYAAAIAEKMKVSQALKDKLKAAALLHDIGKVGVPGWILRGNGPLSEDDRQIIEQHPIASVEILGSIGVFGQELPIIKQHHERFDGGGYPDGLRGKEITIGARILAVADVFDALTSRRPHAPAKSCQDALREIVDCSGSQFDPEVVDAFQEAYEEHKELWPLSNSDSLIERTTRCVTETVLH